MSFASDMAKFAALTNASLDETGRAIALELFGSVIKDTPADTGRARGSWQATIGTPATGDPVRTESDAMAQVASEAGKFEMGKLVWLSSNLPYIYRLEYLGWSQQAPSGMARKNVARIQSIVRIAARDNRV